MYYYRRIFFRGFQESKLQVNYDEFMSKLNTKKFSFVIFIVCIIAFMFTISDIINSVFWIPEAALFVLAFITLVISILKKQINLRVRQFVMFAIVNMCFTIIITNVYISQKVNFYEMAIFLTFFYTFNENGPVFTLYYFLITIIYGTLLILNQHQILCINPTSFFLNRSVEMKPAQTSNNEFMKEECILNYFPNDFVLTNVISLLFINIFGLLYNIYIGKINLQIYLRKYTSQKIIDSSDLVIFFLKYAKILL